MHSPATCSHGLEVTARPLRVRVVAALVGFLVACTAAVALTAAPAGAGTVDDEARLFQLTNTARAQYGRPALAYDAAASNVARAWAQELARSGSLRHNPNLAAQVGSLVTSQWQAIGENVGYAGSIDQVHAAYMNSTGHRNNILGNYNRVGVGSARDGSGRVWTAVVFVLGPALHVVPVTAFSPFPSAAAMVHQQYLDLLGRAADTGGLNAWANALLTGAQRPADMVSGFVNSSEFGAVVEPIIRLYLAYFQRLPDTAGLFNWLGARRSGMTISGVSAAFAGSSEFRNRYGSLTNIQFVELVYRNVLGRASDPAGLAHWVGLLTQGILDRGGVMLSFSESSEFRNATNATVKVSAVYFGLLRRAPDPTGLQNWVTAFRAGRPLADLVGGFLASSEYRRRFGA